MRPHESDPPELWGRAALASAREPAARRALLAALGEGASAACWAAAGPVLLHLVRGAARGDVLRALEARGAAAVVGPALRYALVGELLGSSGATRASCVRALRAAKEDPGAVPATALALAIAAKVPPARSGGERARAALEAWQRGGGEDPLAEAALAAAGGPVERWRAWLDGRATEPWLDASLVLATAGAPRASVEHLRHIAGHVIERDARASGYAAALLRYLARDAAGAPGLPSSATNVGWRGTAASALARTALSLEGPTEALAHLAEACAAGAFEAHVARAAVRACVRDARRGPGVAAAALDASARRFAEALRDGASRAGASLELLAGLRGLYAALLGRDDEALDEAALAGPGWLTDGARAELLCAGLEVAALDAHAVALTELERSAGPPPPATTPALRALAQESPSAVVRARARALATRRER